LAFAEASFLWQSVVFYGSRHHTVLFYAKTESHTLFHGNLLKFSIFHVPTAILMGLFAAARQGVDASTAGVAHFKPSKNGDPIMIGVALEIRQPSGKSRVS
jgi:hypothetical protein